jgi:uncharacterized protein YkwD
MTRTAAKLTLAALLAFACTASASDDAIPPDENRYAASLGKLVNDYRARKGLGALAVDARLVAIAGTHSAYMASAGRLSHDRFDERFRASGFSLCVENVGWNYSTPAAQLAGWQGSPEHNRNLLDMRVTAMGIAQRAQYVTFVACR